MDIGGTGAHERHVALQPLQLGLHGIVHGLRTRGVVHAVWYSSRRWYVSAGQASMART